MGCQKQDIWVAGEWDALGRRRTECLGSSKNRMLWVPGGSSEISCWTERERETRQWGRENGATEGERERERREMDGRWFWCGVSPGVREKWEWVSPGVREKWEQEGENEWDGGKWIHTRILPSSKNLFIYF